MKNKILVFTSLVLVLTFGFLFVNQNYLTSNEGGKKQCTGNCQHKTQDKDIKAGGNEWSKYEFVTDKACCDEMKSSMKTELMTFSGVKEVNFSSTCDVSKMTNVTIYYSATETSENALASLVKDKEYNCPDNGNCPHGKCNMKKSGKNI